MVFSPQTSQGHTSRGHLAGAQNRGCGGPGSASSWPAASKGHSLLKKKADALIIRFRKILRELKDVKEQMIQEMKKASFSLAQAKFVADGQVEPCLLVPVHSGCNFLWNPQCRWRISSQIGVEVRGR